MKFDHTNIGRFFSGAAIVLCFPLGGCAVAVGNNTFAIIVGAGASAFNPPPPEAPAPKKELTLEEIRKNDPVYKAGFQALLDIANHNVPDTYSVLKRDLLAIAELSQQRRNFSIALQQTGLIGGDIRATEAADMTDIHQGSVATDPVVGHHIRNYISLYLEKLMVDVVTANNLEDVKKECNNTLHVGGLLEEDFGITPEDVLRGSKNLPLRSSYEATCITYGLITYRIS